LVSLQDVMSKNTPIKSAAELGQAMRKSADWCFWIAGLTAVNAAMTISGSDVSFIMGTMLAQVVMFASRESGSAPVQAVALIVNVAVIAYFVVFGLLARRGQRWAFVMALLGYGLDSLLLILAPSALAIGFHLWALVMLGMGWSLVGAWREAVAREAAQLPPLVSVPEGTAAHHPPPALARDPATLPPPAVTS
jgi:hypothetical protein